MILMTNSISAPTKSRYQISNYNAKYETRTSQLNVQLTLMCESMVQTVIIFEARETCMHTCSLNRVTWFHFYKVVSFELICACVPIAELSLSML